jgi:1-acyl-sn-glycerol-3-phosphate acyltransferase
MTPYSVPIANRLLRGIFRPIFRLIFFLLSDVKIIGKENIPQGKPYLITMNHISLFEAPFIAAFWPMPFEAAGAVEIWSRPGQAFLVRLYAGIQVHRGDFDRQVLDTMIAALKSGRPLLIAPEGRRSHVPGMQRAQPGAAYIVDKTSAPVLPVGIVGTTEDFFSRAIRLHRPTIEMRIGKPINLPPVEGKGADRRAALQASADQIMLAIAALIPPEYRGVYQTSGGSV